MIEIRNLVVLTLICSNYVIAYPELNPVVEITKINYNQDCIKMCENMAHTIIWRGCVSKTTGINLTGKIPSTIMVSLGEKIKDLRVKGDFLSCLSEGQNTMDISGCLNENCKKTSFTYLVSDEFKDFISTIKSSAEEVKKIIQHEINLSSQSYIEGNIDDLLKKHCKYSKLLTTIKDPEAQILSGRICWKKTHMFCYKPSAKNYINLLKVRAIRNPYKCPDNPRNEECDLLLKELDIISDEIDKLKDKNDHPLSTKVIDDFPGSNIQKKIDLYRLDVNKCEQPQLS